MWVGGSVAWRGKVVDTVSQLTFSEASGSALTVTFLSTLTLDIAAPRNSSLIVNIEGTRKKEREKILCGEVVINVA